MAKSGVAYQLCVNKAPEFWQNSNRFVIFGAFSVSVNVALNYTSDNTILFIGCLLCSSLALEHVGSNNSTITTLLAPANECYC